MQKVKGEPYGHHKWSDNVAYYLRKTNKGKFFSYFLTVFLLYAWLLPFPAFSQNQHDARKDLERMGVSYTQVEFFNRVKQGDSVVVNLFLAAGMHPDTKDKGGWTAMMHAVLEGYAGIVKQLLAKGVDINVKNKKGVTALMFAAQKNRTEIVNMLLDSGADPNPGDPGFTPALVFPAANGNTAMVKALIDRGANVDRKDKYGYTPLVYAIENHHTDIAKLLLDHGADADIFTDLYHEPSLILVAKKGYTDMIKLLLAKGADVHVRGISKRTVLMEAALNGKAEMVKILLDKGADINANDNRRYTALMLASKIGHAEVVQVLLNREADIYLKNSRGLTALRVAELYEQEDIVQILKKAGLEKGATPLPDLAKKLENAMAKHFPDVRCRVFKDKGTIHFYFDIWKESPTDEYTGKLLNGAVALVAVTKLMRLHEADGTPSKVYFTHKEKTTIGWIYTNDCETAKNIVDPHERRRFIQAKFHLQ